MPSGTSSERADRLNAFAIFFSLLVFYTIFRQVDLTYDGAGFLHYFKSFVDPGHPHHLLFGRTLTLFTRVGGLFQITPAAAGKFQAAFFTAAACGLYHVWLRREGVGRAMAALFALLLGLNETALENATSVEVYGASIFASVLALMAWSGVVARPGARASIKLFLACLLVGAFHLGFCFLPLAIYASLAGRERGLKGQIGWALHGAGVLAVLLAWLWIEGRFAPGEAKSGEEFFSILAQADAPWEYAARVVIDPMAHWARYTGLILAAGAFGMGLMKRERPAAWRLAAWATAVFFAFYILWTPDHGSFYYPLAPIWGLFSALALERMLASHKRITFLLVLAFVAVWGLLFMVLPANLGPIEFVPPRFALGAAFWLVTAGGGLAGMIWAWRNGRRPLRGRSENMIANPGNRFAHPGATVGDPSGVGEGRGIQEVDLEWGEAEMDHGTERHSSIIISSRRMIIISGAALALTGAAYYPNLIRFKRPEPDLWTLHEFDSMVPAGARLVGWFPEIHSHEQRPREVISIMEMLEHEGEMAEGRLQIKRWLQESVGPWGRPVYFDRPAWEQRDLLWGRFGGPNGVPLAYEDFNFAPRHTRRAVFYELQWSPREAPPGSDAALEPYTVEHWGETPVQWTRRSARFWVEPRAGRGRVKYMVGHPDASPERPVEVTLRRNGGVVERKTHTAPGYFEMTLESDSPTSAAIELRVDLNRFWLADDGRELGLAVFPIEFEDSQN